MKRTSIAFFTIILVVTTVVLWVLLSEPQPERPNTIANQDRPDEAKLEEVKTKAAAVKVAEARGDQGVLETAKQELAEAVGGRAGRMLQMAMDRNAPITMYGKVVDQHGRPVVGARVNLIVAGGGTFAPGTGPTFYKTDAEGRFKVQAKGSQIQISSIEHPEVSAYLTRHVSDGKIVGGKLLKGASPYGGVRSSLDVQIHAARGTP
ncbi:hypothetical protein [Thiohalomonas denitrificans]|uniref:hypothetical protein n=1 Tax=Thiohalomonas denitrificans TaxID=415747 RepID=UPI0026EDF7AB|nr:hypothetical protein [Thiohalomonas denitrificans]